MPPLLAPVVWALLELAAAIITAKEVYDTFKSLYDGIDEYKKNLAAAKEKLKDAVEALKREIDANIDEKTEQAFLATALEWDDTKEQSETTKKAKGDKGEGGSQIETAIKLNIPFRSFISKICAQANKVPMISLRRKKGVTIEDLPKAKKKILQEIIRVGAEEIGDIENIDSFIMVRMRQLMASLLFEFIDELLDWHSPLKAEVCFGPPAGFDDPKLESGTKLLRSGSLLNPFYPLPYRQRGSIAADLAIPDYRKKPLKKDNLFGIIEIKFEGDKIKNLQFDNYDKLNKACEKVKTGVTGKGRTLGGKGVTIGCRVALFRYPLDVAVDPKDKDKKQDEQHDKEQSNQKANKSNRRGNRH